MGTPRPSTTWRGKYPTGSPSTSAGPAPYFRGVYGKVTRSATIGAGAVAANLSEGELPEGVGFAVADEGVTMSYKYRTVRVRGTELVGTIARKHGSAAEIYETSKGPSTSVVPVYFEATGEIRFFDRSVLEDVVTPA